MGRNLVSGGGWKIVKGVRKCTISLEKGLKFPCAVSPNYPKHYSNEVACEIQMKKTNYVSLHGSTEKYFDYLTLSGRQYSGSLKGRKVHVKGNAKWNADFFEATRGWKFCKTTKPKLRITPKKWATKKITIGKSGRNKKCVSGPGFRCEKNAGNKGKRVNKDYRNAPDKFEISYSGGKVCAHRLDRPGHGWGMNLQIMCRKRR